MKNVLALATLLTAASLSSFAPLALASGEEKGMTITTTRELAFPADGSVAEFDSLNHFYAEKVVRNVDLILGYRFEHRWGERNNRDFVEVMEVREWSDLDNLNQLLQQSLEAALPLKEDRDTFIRRLDKYFAHKHFHEDLTTADAPGK